ncbi:MAG: hypothetical protein H7A55_11090 [Verrucomicrobiaceae bacterium]|nr:hypothetical protein [Verrucomicrobiaceae bacterium]
MTKREQNLAGMMLILLIGGGTFLGFTKLKKWKQFIDEEEQIVEMRETEASALLAEREMWTQRSKWLADKQPVFTDRASGEKEFLELITSSAKAQNIDLRQNQPTAPIDLGGMKAATMQVQAHADPGALGRWLYELQQPQTFIKIPALAIEPDEDENGKVNASLNIEKWYRVNPS